MYKDIENDLNIKVDPEELKRTADEAVAKINAYRKSLDVISQRISSSSSYWSGRGNEAFIRNFCQLKKNIENSVDEYEKYAKKLLDYSEVYIEVGKKTKMMAESISDENFTLF